MRGRGQLLNKAAVAVEKAVYCLEGQGLGQGEGESEEMGRRFDVIQKVRGLLPQEQTASVDESQVKLALDELNSYIKEQLNIAEGNTNTNAITSEGNEGNDNRGDRGPSPVPLKKTKKEKGSTISSSQVVVVSEEEKRRVPMLAELSEAVKEAENFWHRSKALFEWQVKN